jgi:uncharacterized protein YjbI with pentapeptide repeats
MPIKPALQSLSDWIGDAAKAAKGAADLTIESGLLRDSLGELSEVGGLTGALFKLGSRAIPDPTPEQRIALRLHRTFLTAFDRELKDRPDLVSTKVWNRYIRTRLPEVATEKLSGEFTWLSIFGSSGRKPSRSWPIVGELADLGRVWIAEMVTEEGNYAPDLVQRTADDIRGRLHEALTREIDSLLTDPAVRVAIDEAQPRATRDALELLAQELTKLRHLSLFEEVPQDAVYIPSRIKIVDLKDSEAEIEWFKVKDREGGDQILFEAIRDGHPRLFVLEGDMGVGKSCLMRSLASQLAEQYRINRRHAPIYVRWRDIYEQQDLVKAIAEQLNADYGLPFQDLPDQRDILYLVDGFDEMSSHQESHVTQCFERLAKLVHRGCSVVVAMRSTVITPGLHLAWKDRKAVVAQVQEFDKAAIDAWVEKWRAQSKSQDITGEQLRALGDEKVVSNPLLLYMLAKCVGPVTRGKKASLTRTEVFRIFVDETIRGKLRTSPENFPFHFRKEDYRFLLQEIAYLASWPQYARKCPARLVRERIEESFLKDLSFQDIRTAFVLYFFSPGDLAGDKFEFQPEGFRQYLLAEWCVRAQLDALKNKPEHSLARTKDQAIDALAQFPLGEEERLLLNEIYEEVGGLAVQDEKALSDRITCLSRKEDNAPDVITLLYKRVRNEAEEPPARVWGYDKVDIPKGQETPIGLADLRLLSNYWDQCMVATFGLYRGLKKDPSRDKIFHNNPRSLGSFMRTLYVVRNFSFAAPIDLSRSNLSSTIDLIALGMEKANLSGSNLSDSTINNSFLSQADLSSANLLNVKASGSDLTEANLAGANLDGASLISANLTGAKLTGTTLRRALLVKAKLIRTDLTGAMLEGAYMSEADLDEADLKRADLNDVDLHGAKLIRAVLTETNLTGTNLTGANLTEANLIGADLTEAKLTRANLSGADLTGAIISRKQLSQTLGIPRFLPDSTKQLEQE